MAIGKQVRRVEIRVMPKWACQCLLRITTRLILGTAPDLKRAIRSQDQLQSQVRFNTVEEITSHKSRLQCLNPTL